MVMKQIPATPGEDRPQATGVAVAEEDAEDMVMRPVCYFCQGYRLWIRVQHLPIIVDSDMALALNDRAAGSENNHGRSVEERGGRGGRGGRGFRGGRGGARGDRQHRGLPKFVLSSTLTKLLLKNESFQ